MLVFSMCILKSICYFQPIVDPGIHDVCINSLGKVTWSDLTYNGAMGSNHILNGGIPLCQIWSSLNPFFYLASLTRGILNKDPTFWPVEARPASLFLLGLPLAENAFDEVII
jgi:hypothetical protein